MNQEIRVMNHWLISLDLIIIDTITSEMFSPLKADCVCHKFTQILQFPLSCESAHRMMTNEVIEISATKSFAFN